MCKAILLLLVLGAMSGCGGGGGNPDVTSTTGFSAPLTVAKAISLGLNNGQAQDVIIEFEATAIQAEAALHRKANMPDIDPPDALALKATRFAALKQQVFATMDLTNLEVTKEYSHLPMVAMKVNSTTALNHLLARPEIIAIYENAAHYPTLAQSLPVIGQPTAVSAGFTGAGATIAVLDTGADYTRAAFGSCSAPGENCKVVFAQDFANDDGSLDDDGHGTNVAGIVIGVAPEARVAALDVFSLNGIAYSADIIAAINWSIANQGPPYNIVAMNLSLGDEVENTTQCASNWSTTPFANARNAGILPVVAAGNDGFTNGLSSPACAPSAVSVGATYDSNVGEIAWGDPLLCTDELTSMDMVTCFSNSASYLTFLAPGAMITAAGIQMGGTSQAAPHVAGAWALLKQKKTILTVSEGLNALSSTGVQVTDTRNNIVSPRIQIDAALNAISWWPLPVYDFNSDGFSDILWRHNTTGENIIWKSASSATTQPVATRSIPDWIVAGIGDFDGDGFSDIMWHNNGVGVNAIWRSGNSATTQPVGRLSIPDWTVAGIGDFDGDGVSDILWRNTRLGINTIWRSADSATTQHVGRLSNLDWTVAGVGDFDGDTVSDILWRNTRLGVNIIWRSGDSATTQHVGRVSNLDWVVAGIGDFDGDGVSDILWRNKSIGINTIWLSANSATRQAVGNVANMDWIVAGVADYDGDGISDILWRNTITGVNTIWRSANSATRQAVPNVGVTAWEVK